ncbi:MAG: hypothetical protein LBS45_12195 [Synergistaceae bacterium]|nr:hypothetical protein [Synergistaceae bacterium]
MSIAILTLMGVAVILVLRPRFKRIKNFPFFTINTTAKAKNSKKPSNWREAAFAANPLAGIKIPIPSKQGNPPLCTHLGVPEKTRKKLENFLYRNHNARSEGLVQEFLAIAEKDGQVLSFPPEIADILNSRRKRGACSLKQIAEVYIRHELNVIDARETLKSCVDLDIRYVIIRTAADSRVCPVCKKRNRKRYHINRIPMIPMCWECRCYYEPVIPP